MSVVWAAALLPMSAASSFAVLIGGRVILDPYTGGTLRASSDGAHPPSSGQSEVRVPDSQVAET